MLEAERFKQGLSRGLQAIGLVLPGVVPEAADDDRDEPPPVRL